jgi:hypothetical protein
MMWGECLMQVKVWVVQFADDRTEIDCGDWMNEELGDIFAFLLKVGKGL